MNNLSPLAVPLALSAAVGLGLYLSRSKEKLGPQPGPSPGPGPMPGPQPGPQPSPAPSQDITALLAQFQVLMTQFATTGNVDLNQADTVASALEANGLQQQAVALRGVIAQVRARQAQGGMGPGQPGAPNPFPSVLPALVQQQMEAYLRDPPSGDPALLAVQIDALVAKLQTDYPGGFSTQISLLQNRAKNLRNLGPTVSGWGLRPMYAPGWYR